VRRSVGYVEKANVSLYDISLAVTVGMSGHITCPLAVTACGQPGGCRWRPNSVVVTVVLVVVSLPASGMVIVVMVVVLLVVSPTDPGMVVVAPRSTHVSNARSHPSMGKALHHT